MSFILFSGTEIATTPSSIAVIFAIKEMLSSVNNSLRVPLVTKITFLSKPVTLLENVRVKVILRSFTKSDDFFLISSSGGVLLNSKIICVSRLGLLLTSCTAASGIVRDTIPSF